VIPYRLFCVTLSTPNIERTVSWYRENLGYEVYARRDFPQVGARVAVLEAGDLRLELLEHKDRLTPGPRSDREELQRRSQFAVLVDDLDEKIAELRRKDVRLMWNQRVDHDLGVRSQFIKDCDGNLIQLVELIDPPGPARRRRLDA
jgi:catechol 2,3-dioxygenase-like lactoylglutathione lyase family enzyme